MKVTRRSPLTGKETTMDLPVTQEQLDEVTKPVGSRRVIQQIFPDLSPAAREFILSGYTQEDWDEMFPPEPTEAFDDDMPF